MFYRGQSSKIIGFPSNNGLCNGFYDAACWFDQADLIRLFKLNSLKQNVKLIIFVLEHRNRY